MNFFTRHSDLFLYGGMIGALMVAWYRLQFNEDLVSPAQRERTFAILKNNLTFGYFPAPPPLHVSQHQSALRGFLYSTFSSFTPAHFFFIYCLFSLHATRSNLVDAQSISLRLGITTLTQQEVQLSPREQRERDDARAALSKAEAAQARKERRALYAKLDASNRTA